MNDMVQAFIDSIKEREHVLRLIENIDLLIDFTANQKETTLLIKNGDFSIIEKSDYHDCEISGEEDKIKDFIEGRQKLRNLIKNGELHVNASFRTILLLESLFFLGKSENYLLKIV